MKFHIFLILLTAALLLASLAAFPLSVRMGMESTDPDGIEMLGFMIAVGLILLTCTSASVTAAVWVAKLRHK